MNRPIFFDNASTTRCFDFAAELLRRYGTEEYGNPSSSHQFGRQSAQAIAAARSFFAAEFGVTPRQVIFTGSGSESDNLAIYGTALSALARQESRRRVICSAIEHPAVRKTVQSLAALGFDPVLCPVTPEGQLRSDALSGRLSEATLLVSVHRVNNIVGALLPVEEIAALVKERAPGALFHTDAVQAFGRVELPRAGSAVDLVSISGHKVGAPKGIGALIVLNPALLADGLRPLIWGGDQEGGFRSGTQNAGLIAAFHAAAEHTLKSRERHALHTLKLREIFEAGLRELGLQERLRINSPKVGVPHIIHLSFPPYPGALMAQLLEERGCLVSTGSACSSGKEAPDAVLCALGLPPEHCRSAIRISFSEENRPEDVEHLVRSLGESVNQLRTLIPS